MSNSNILVKNDLTSNLESTTIDTNESSSSSNVFSAPMGIEQVSSSYSKFQSNTLNPSERINPFDKNKQPTLGAAAVSASDSSTPKLIESSTSSNPSSACTGSTLDALTKNCYTTTSATISSSNLYTSESSKHSTSTASGILYSGSNLTKVSESNPTSKTTVDDYLNKKSENVSVVASKPVPANTRASAAKYAFGSAQYSTGSMSDSEIIFGSTDIPDTLSRRLQFGSNSSNTVDASNSIFETSRNMSSFNRSLSVSSDANGDFANDPRVNTSYRIYEGIQNEAFQDFDSPVKTSASSIPPSTETVNFSSSYISGSKLFNDEEEYDLK